MVADEEIIIDLDLIKNTSQINLLYNAHRIIFIMIKKHTLIKLKSNKVKTILKNL